MSQSEVIDRDLLKQFEAYIKALQCSRRGKRRTTARDKTPPNATKKRGVCWGCGLPGHIQRNCTARWRTSELFCEDSGG